MGWGRWKYYRNLSNAVGYEERKAGHYLDFGTSDRGGRRIEGDTSAAWISCRDGIHAAQLILEFNIPTAETHVIYITLSSPNVPTRNESSCFRKSDESVCISLFRRALSNSCVGFEPSSEIIMFPSTLLNVQNNEKRVREAKITE